MSQSPQTRELDSSSTGPNPEELDVEAESQAGPSSQLLFNRNPHGNNQYKDCPKKDDPRIPGLLAEYHRRLITSKEDISALLLAEHGIKMSPSTVTRRKRELGLQSGGATVKKMDEEEARQLVFKHLAEDSARKSGPRSIRERIASKDSVHLPRDFISKVMHEVDPEGFALRHPLSKKGDSEQPAPPVPGPNSQWSIDGHGELGFIGFPVYGVKDVVTRFELLLRVVPSNRPKLALAYLWLSTVKERGGYPKQEAADSSTDTVIVDGLVHALREATRPDLLPNEKPVQRFLRMLEKITIERGWKQLRMDFASDAKSRWETGQGRLNQQNQVHGMLVGWLWSSVIQRGLDDLRNDTNNHKSRKDKKKNPQRPNGTTPRLAYTLCGKFGAQDMLQPVDVKVVEELMEGIGGEDVIRIVPLAFEQQATNVLLLLGKSLSDVTFQTIWDVFDEMLPHMTVLM